GHDRDHGDLPAVDRGPIDRTLATRNRSRPVDPTAVENNRGWRTGDLNDGLRDSPADRDPRDVEPRSIVEVLIVQPERADAILDHDGNRSATRLRDAVNPCRVRPKEIIFTDRQMGHRRPRL